MKKYWSVFYLSVLDTFEYRFDLVLQAAKYSMMIILMSVVWLAVAKQNPDLPLDRTQITAYFFLAAMMYSLSNFHTFYIEDDIKLGFLSKFLLRPISCFWYYWMYQFGHSSIETILKIVVMLPLLYVLGVSLPLRLENVVLLLIFIPVIFSFSFSIFTLVSTFAFWINETWAIRWATNILFRFLAGMFVPLTFLSSFWQSLLWWLPFGHLTNTPIQVAMGTFTITQGLQGLAILCGWWILVYGAQVWLWRQGIRAYEGTGI